MLCLKCGNKAPLDSFFCNQCGIRLENVSSAQSNEKTLWEARPSAKIFAPAWLLHAVSTAVLASLWFFVLDQARQWQVTRIFFALLVFVPMSLLIARTVSVQARLHFRLTTQRIVKEVGLFNRTIREIDLMRINDVSVRQNFLQRLFNTGTIILSAPTDQDQPRLVMRGIDNPIAVKEKIRLQAQLRRQSTIHFERI